MNSNQRHETEELARLRHENEQLRAQLAQVELKMAEKYRQQLKQEIASQIQTWQHTTSELEAVFTALPDLYFRFDAQGTYLDYKADREDLLVPPEQLLGRRLYETLPTDLARQFEQAIAKVIETKVTCQVDYSMTGVHGQKYFEARFSPLLHDQVIMLARDVTHTVLLQQELEQSHDLLEERVLDRTYRLELIMQLSGHLNSILDLEHLLETMVNQIKNGFGYYHVNVYLLNSVTNRLEIMAGSGNVGKLLKVQRHQVALGEGVVGQVASSGIPFLSNQAQTAAGFSPHPLLSLTKSELAVPLRKGEQLLGVLDIQSESLNQFSEADVALMQSIADQAAIAVDNARLLGEQQKTIAQLQESNTLNRDYTRVLEISTDISRQITAILDLDELLGYVVNRVHNEFNFYHTHIYLMNEDDTELVMVYGYGQVGRELKARGHRLRVGRGIVGTVAMTNAPFVSNRVDEVSNFVRNPLLPMTNSELAVPMRKGLKVLGVLDVQSERLNRFSKAEVKLLQSIGDQIAIAVDNARLLAQHKETIEKLQELDRLKSEFLTIMSHELRTPLNAILGFAELLVLGISGDLPDLAQNDAKLIYSSGQHLLTILNDILDISKIEAGMMELVLEELDITEILPEVMAAAESMVKNKPVTLILNAPEQLPLIHADKTRFKQVVLNLLDNAIKFTEHGSVTLQVEPQLEQKQMLFTVIDTGIGIPEDKQSLVFERFKQVDMSRTRKYEGTGLGLTICQELVQMHQGQMGLRSEVGQGSAFFFNIPIVN